MSKQDFENLIKKHNTSKANTEIDWEKQKDEWFDFIKIFYTSVESWLKKYVDNKQLSYKYIDSSLTEEYLGTYTVKKMQIDFIGQQISLDPIGTLLIGTKGRIDMEGARGRVQFILADKDSKGIKINVSVSINGEASNKTNQDSMPDWTWKIVIRDSRRISYDEFNEENFFSALVEVANG